MLESPDIINCNPICFVDFHRYNDVMYLVQHSLPIPILVHWYIFDRNDSATHQSPYRTGVSAVSANLGYKTYPINDPTQQCVCKSEA